MSVNLKNKSKLTHCDGRRPEPRLSKQRPRGRGVNKIYSPAARDFQPGRTKKNSCPLMHALLAAGCGELLLPQKREVACPGWVTVHMGGAAVVARGVKLDSTDEFVDPKFSVIGGVADQGAVAVSKSMAQLGDLPNPLR